MLWQALVAVLVEFLAGAALEWLRDLLKRLPQRPLSPSEAVAVGEVFAAARAQLWWWQIGKKAVLDRALKVATAHATDLVRAARRERVQPVMTGAEYAHVTAA